ncbi:MAG: ATP-binding cassette domain-containing protein [Bacteroidales bacterium]|nr:ATP-binding cassette domain-containing protein [Bacteroidales bacterium]MBN2762573.1 ATP-binding cassette domain-containing protein [Bacteroidales bacterium]
METGNIITIQNLYKAFAGKTVLEDINLGLRPGENLVVLGKSGTGKTVLLKCIVGLLTPDNGSIQVFDTNVEKCTHDELDKIRTRIGYVFQHGALYDSISLRENMLFPLMRNTRFFKTSEKEMKQLVEKNLKSVDLLDAIDKMPGELSGGMKKRAGLARALMLSPEIMLYDEPTSGLDPFTAQEISDLIMSIQREKGTASIIVTHDMKCAETVSDRICILHNGKFIAEGNYKTLGVSEDRHVSMFFST